MIRYKMPILEEIKKAGYSTARLRNEKLLGENAIQSLRHDEMVGIATLNKICRILDRQPGELIEYVDE